jgi:outer membrane protein OmpA-like peptidoglycan-associated protein
VKRTARRRQRGGEMSDRRFFRTHGSRHAAGVAHGKKKRAQVCVVDAQLCSADPDPDDQEPKITGLYQESNGGKRPRFTLHVNQAGDHVCVWIRQVLHSGFGPNEHISRRWHFYGRRDRGQQEFRLFKDAYTWDYNDGTIKPYRSVGPGGWSLTVTASGITDGEPLNFERSIGGDRPASSERVREELQAEGSAVALSILQREYYPLPYYDYRRIFDAAQRIHPFIDAFFNQSRNKLGDFGFEAWMAWNQRILDLDNFVAQEIFHFQPRKPSGLLGKGAETALKSDGTLYSWHASDLEEVRSEALNAMTLEHVRDLETRSIVDWLSYILHLRNDTRLNPNGWAAYEDFVAIKKLLRLEASSPHKKPYKYTFSFRGVSGEAAFFLGLKGSIGRLVISRDDVELGTYLFFIGSVLAGAKGGASPLKDDYDVVDIARWDAADFEGWLQYVEVGVEASAGPIGGDQKVGAIAVIGNGRNVSLVIDLTDYGMDPKASKKKSGKIKMSYGASGNLGGGRIWLQSAGKPTTIKDQNSQPETVEFLSKLSGNQLVHFFEGDSRLTPWGRQVLGMFCADELRVLRSLESSVSVIGYTDPKGSDESNQNLSEHRAKNTMQALEEITGTLHAKQERVEGLGELPSKLEGHIRNGAEDPKWRRVNVILNDHILLELHVPKAVLAK